MPIRSRQEVGFVGEPRGLVDEQFRGGQGLLPGFDGHQRSCDGVQREHSRDGTQFHTVEQCEEAPALAERRRRVGVGKLCEQDLSRTRLEFDIAEGLEDLAPPDAEGVGFIVIALAAHRGRESDQCAGELAIVSDPFGYSHRLLRARPSEPDIAAYSELPVRTGVVESRKGRRLSQVCGTRRPEFQQSPPVQAGDLPVREFEQGHDEVAHLAVATQASGLMNRVDPVGGLG